MEYRRTTLHPYDEEDPCDDIESHSWAYPEEHTSPCWAYPEERQSPFYVLWDEFKNLIWRCINKEFKSQ